MEGRKVVGRCYIILYSYTSNKQINDGEGRCVCVSICSGEVLGVQYSYKTKTTTHKYDMDESL